MDRDPNAAAYCPECGTEYRPGFTVCADDGAELVPGPKPEPPPEPEMAPEPEPLVGRWVAIARYGAEERARLLAGRLDAEGIPSRVDPEWASTHYGPGTSSFLGRPFEVLVPDDRVAEARRILDEVERS